MGPCFRGMENGWKDIEPISPSFLQWGHALGAWKTAASQQLAQAKAAPSMGPCFRGMENSIVDTTGKDTAEAFNGAML